MIGLSVHFGFGLLTYLWLKESQSKMRVQFSVCPGFFIYFLPGSIYLRKDVRFQQLAISHITQYI